MTSRHIYSQTGQDALSDFLLKRYGNIPQTEKYEGTYIDVGACEPVETSNTYYFYKKGWRGLCVEPNHDLADQFRIHRPEDIFLGIAIGDKCEIKDLHKFSNPQWNTFDSSRVPRIVKKYQGKFEYLGSHKIQVKTLDQIIKENNIKKIDILSVDVEGFELSVFNGLDFDFIRPKLIVFENIIPFSEIQNNEVILYLKNQGYNLSAHTGHDAFMLDSKITSK